MYYLYILKNPGDKRYYVGVTSDPNQRLLEHNVGQVRSTKSHRPYTIVHTERFSSLSAARAQEKRIKRAGHVARYLKNFAAPSSNG